MVQGLVRKISVREISTREIKVRQINALPRRAKTIMNMTMKPLFMVFLVLWLGACANRLQLHPALGVPATDALHGTPAQSLLASADSSASAGHEQAASLYLERAIRLAPNSSWLYKKMADLRLGAGDARAAEGFARHALGNATAADKRYRASLYELLATCLSRQGDMTGADKARQQAHALLAD